ADIDAFIDAVWLEDGSSANTSAAYRRDSTGFARWLEDPEAYARERADRHGEAASAPASPAGPAKASAEAGKADIVTDHIDRFDATGIQLKSGRHLDADVIITATGSRSTMGGKIASSLDGVPMNFADHFYYKGCMFSNVPNSVAVFGYLNASWTSRADLISD
ncbi:hypothetical protein OY671_009425, partial [Metschnikowia pulcherrima]